MVSTLRRVQQQRQEEKKATERKETSRTQAQDSGVQTLCDVFLEAAKEYTFRDSNGNFYRITRVFPGAPDRLDFEYEKLDADGKEVVDRSTTFAGSHARDMAILTLQFPGLPDSDYDGSHP